MSSQVVESEGIPQPGEVFAGKYRVEEVIGSGGMGVVVTAQHIDLGQRVAVKFLRPSVALKGDAVARFQREARAAAGIRSEHVVRVHDVGKLDSGASYLVMEHLAGTDLEQHVRARGPLPVAEAVDYLLQACEAIAEAHALGIVHRDLKPANLFLTVRADGSPLVKVLDFGISKIASPEGPGAAPSLTATSDVLGSPYFMSPEQIRSFKNVDARTDVWALGVILHKLLTAKQPFDAETASSCIAKIVADPPTPLRATRPDAPVEIERVLLQCLEKDPGRRLQSVAELAAALLPWAPARSRVSVERVLRVHAGSSPSLTVGTSGAFPAQRMPSVPDEKEAAPVAGAPLPSIFPDALPARRRRVLLVAGGISAAIVLAVLALTWTADPPQGAPALADAPPGQTTATPSTTPQAPSTPSPQPNPTTAPASPATNAAGQAPALSSAKPGAPKPKGPATKGPAAPKGDLTGPLETTL